jgi:hypothetical protein
MSKLRAKESELSLAKGFGLDLSGSVLIYVFNRSKSDPHFPHVLLVVFYPNPGAGEGGNVQRVPDMGLFFVSKPREQLNFR